MSRFTLLAGIAALLFAFPCAAEDSFKIRIRKEEKPGDRHYVQETEKTTQKIIVTDPDGKILNKSEEQPDRHEIYEETILDKEPGKRPHKLTRKYEKAIVKEAGKDVELPLGGKTVTVERKAGKYAFKLDDGELNAPILKFLNDSFKGESENEEKFDEVFFSKDAVKVGDTWKCDAKGIMTEVLKDESGNIDASKATATGKLLETYAKDGQTYGKIEINVNAPVKALGKGADAIEAKPGSFFKLKLNIDACIDGSQAAGAIKGEIEVLVTADITMPTGQKAAFKLTVTSTMSETRKQLMK